MSRVAKAKACPFCRSTDSFVECMDFGSFAVVCNGCGARGPAADGDGCDETASNSAGKRSAVREWNKRPRTLQTPAPSTDGPKGQDGQLRDEHVSSGARPLWEKTDG